MTTAAPSAVRAWARAHGYAVPDRGRIPGRVLDAYAAAAQVSAPAPTPPEQQLAALAASFRALSADFAALREEPVTVAGNGLPRDTTEPAAAATARGRLPQR